MAGPVTAALEFGRRGLQGRVGWISFPPSCRDRCHHSAGAGPAGAYRLSGTREEELVIGAANVPRLHTLRRFPGRMPTVEARPKRSAALQRTHSFEEFLDPFRVDG